MSGNINNPWVIGVGVLGNIFSFMVILSPVSTFIRVYKKKSTESFHSTPYVVGLCSAMMWVYYALLTFDVLVITINAAACVVEFIYIAMFLFYAPKKAKATALKLVMLLNVGCFGPVVLLTLVLLKGHQRSLITGWICSSFAVGVFAAPLSIIKLVIKTKSAEYMPFSLSFFLTLSAAAWLAYGLMLKDFFITVPNVFGLIFGLAQMVLYCIYMNPKRDQNEKKHHPADLIPVTTKSDTEVIEELKTIQVDDLAKN